MYDLENVNGVGPRTAEKLQRAGFNSIELLAKAEYQDLVGKSGLSLLVAKRLINVAKENKKKNKMQANKKQKELKNIIPTVSQILQSGIRGGSITSLKQELLKRAIKIPHVRKRIIRKLSAELFD